MKKITILTRWIILLTISVFNLTACSLLLPAPAYNPNLYTLDVRPVNFSPVVNANKTLLVLPTVSVLELTTTKMLYVLHPHQINYFAKNQWVASPGQLLTPLIAQQLRSAKAFRAVVTAPFAGEVDFRLNTQLLMFQQEFLTYPSQFHLRLAAQLVATDTDQIIASRQFDVMVEAPADNPYGGVIAANRATQQMLQGLADFCMRASRQH